MGRNYTNTKERATMPSVRDVTTLHPELQLLCVAFLDQCKKNGLNVLITETIRTVQYQDELYAKGRTTPGSIVTNARGSTYSSPHQWGLAFDICKNIRGHEYNDLSFFSSCGAIGRSLGLHWGGDFKSAKDRPHFQWDGKNGCYMPTGVTSQLKAKYGTPEAFKKTWKVEEDMTEQETRKIAKEEAAAAVKAAVKTPPKPDNTPSPYAIGAIDRAKKKGILTGGSGGDLQLHSTMTREAFFVALDKLGLLE